MKTTIKTLSAAATARFQRATRAHSDLFNQHRVDAVMMLVTALPHFILTQLNWAAASTSQMRKPVEQNPWRNAVTVLITPFECDELWKHKPAQMCKLQPQRLHSLGLSWDSAARERCCFIYDCSQTGSANQIFLRAQSFRRLTVSSDSFST